MAIRNDNQNVSEESSRDLQGSPEVNRSRTNLTQEDDDTEEVSNAVEEGDEDLDDEELDEEDFDVDEEDEEEDEEK